MDTRTIGMVMMLVFTELAGPRNGKFIYWFRKKNVVMKEDHYDVNLSILTGCL